MLDFWKTLSAFVITDKQFYTSYSREHQYLQRNVYIEIKLCMIFWSTYFVFPSI